MKSATRLLVLAFFTSCITIFYSCKKDAENPPVTAPSIATTAVSSITITSAEAGGNVTSTGGAEVISRGVCWSTNQNPTVADNKTTDGNGSGTFTSSIAGLTPNTIYYVRAYATNSAGTAYGNQVSFTADQITLATLTTNAVTEIVVNGAVSGGNITSNGGSTVTDWGVCWSTTANPTTEDSRLSLTGGAGGSGIFTGTIINLNPGTDYFIRAYAINDAGTAYGDQITFTTLQGTGVKMADFPGGSGYQALSFSIGTKAYVGLGYDEIADNFVRDFWEWDQMTNIWTRKADPPVSIRKVSLRTRYVCFSIGSKGYVETGGIYRADINFIESPSEFWEYDPATDTWTQKGDIPVTPVRNGAVGFSIGTKGYIGLGIKVEGMYNSYYNDLWEWDQETNLWTEKADFPGGLRTEAVGFSIGNKGYIGIGSVGITSSREFWEWDQATNVWTQKAEFGGDARSAVVAFSIGDKGYIGTGMGDDPQRTAYRDIWEWDQATNVWTQKANFGGSARASAVGFSIGSKGYIGIGAGGTYLNDFWEYDPTLQ
jgi:N-acetylneuraminic acid mutarotase